MDLFKKNGTYFKSHRIRFEYLEQKSQFPTDYHENEILNLNVIISAYQCYCSNIIAYQYYRNDINAYQYITEYCKRSRSETKDVKSKKDNSVRKEDVYHYCMRIDGDFFAIKSNRDYICKFKNLNDATRLVEHATTVVYVLFSKRDVKPLDNRPLIFKCYDSSSDGTFKKALPNIAGAPQQSGSNIRRTQRVPLVMPLVLPLLLVK